ncbi:B-cell receptor CD22-like [Cyprinodon tularosa]|uniref:B-cell receptor CD22-like n=1 Tax=Cyprinodon tularosa TaxID=77115 RepID=UPI0018E23933|nr:B-cell receptor CD22-like [Cyprinodon tularosa]
MKIHQVEHSDAGKYFFRYNNNKGCPNKCIFLKVTDLNILAETADGEAFKEGDSVNLTCINNCDDINTSSAYSWFKDGESINEGHVLHLTNVSTKHSGNYTCSLKVQKDTTSEVFRLDVEYGPKNTSVLIRSSSEADTNGSIILIYSSDAQPPVQNYSWFEIVDGQLLNVGHQAEMFPEHSGQYLCSVSHKHGSQNSTVFTLKMKTWTFLRDVLVTITVAIVLVMTAIIAVCRITKNKSKTTEAAHQEERQQIDATIQHGGSHCFQSEDLIFEETTTEVIYAAIEFQTNRVPNKEQMDYQSESVIYSTVCR